MTFIWLLNISHGKVLVLWPWTSYYEINLGCALRGYIGYDNFTLFLYYYNYYAWWSHISKKKQLNIIEQSRRVPCTLEISYTIGCVKTHPIIYNCYIIVNHIACGGEESRVNSPFLALGPRPGLSATLPSKVYGLYTLCSILKFFRLCPWNTIRHVLVTWGWCTAIN